MVQFSGKYGHPHPHLQITHGFLQLEQLGEKDRDEYGYPLRAKFHDEHNQP